MRAIDADTVKKLIKRALGGATFPHLMAVIVGQIDKAPTIRPDEPRVMTLEETLGGDECWIEGRNGACGYGDALLTDDAERVEFFRPHTISTLDFYAYGKDWRCWTARPTDEQRKAVKWDAAD